MPYMINICIRTCLSPPILYCSSKKHEMQTIMMLLFILALYNWRVCWKKLSPRKTEVLNSLTNIHLVVSCCLSFGVCDNSPLHSLLRIIFKDVHIQSHGIKMFTRSNRLFMEGKL